MNKGKLLGIVSSAVGFVMVIISIVMPKSQGDAIGNYFDDELFSYVDLTPIKNTLLFIGIALLAVGVLLLILRYIKKTNV